MLNRVTEMNKVHNYLFFSVNVGVIQVFLRTEPLSCSSFDAGFEGAFSGPGDKTVIPKQVMK